MLTKLTIKNFKRFETVEIELGNPVVFIGPNNSGKTTALQALALWEIGLRKWIEKRVGENIPKKKAGVAISRREIVSIPVPEAKAFWKSLRVREGIRSEGKTKTKNIVIEIKVEGVSKGKAWKFGMEFDYANEETVYCKPSKDETEANSKRIEVPEELLSLRAAFLQPMSGLLANEARLDPGAINVRIGEGRTAEVIRNICDKVAKDHPEKWQVLVDKMKNLFGVEIKPPVYIPQRGELIMEYKEPPPFKFDLDLSAAGRGLHQTLLLLAFMYYNPGSVLLIDEPDAHLEILRQRQIYQLLTEVGREQESQIIIASHSEIVLNEATNRDVVVAFLGKPHRIDDRGSQLLKSLKDISFEHYYLAEQKGWVLYLEGSTDLAILQAFARALNHPAQKYLERPFFHPVGNQPTQARYHFYGLKEAVRGLKGIAIFDRDVDIKEGTELLEVKWRRREIENYLWHPEVLLSYARDEHNLFSFAKAEIMKECLQDLIPPAALRNPNDNWWINTKASEYLDLIFESYFKKLGIPNLMPKSNYHQLAWFVQKELLDEEIKEKLDATVQVAKQAKPLEGENL